MKALCWHGKGDIRCDDVPDPQIEHGRDAIIKMTACAICGSDLHLMDGYIPFMEKVTSSATNSWAKSSRSDPTTRS
jgi:threonine dehydrogenase-like Zn-dependent dehydrogenase